MLGAAAAILLLLGLLPSQVNGLITALATCLSGNEWMFSSIGQSPCDVAAELATVCYSTTYQVAPLSRQQYYTGPWQGYDNNCLCSSVYYSLLSACSYCQGEEFLSWSIYKYNCTYVHFRVYPYPIPVGVRVPGYAYQDVTGQFNVNLAHRERGVESSRALPSSTNAPAAAAHSRAVIGGSVAGGLVGLGLIVGLVVFLVFRSKQKSRSQNYNSSFQESPDMAVTSTSPGLIQSAMVYNPNDQTYPSSLGDPRGRHPLSSNPNVTPHFTGNDSQNSAHPQSGRYVGMPEV